MVQKIYSWQHWLRFYTGKCDDMLLVGCRSYNAAVNKEDITNIRFSMVFIAGKVCIWIADDISDQDCRWMLVDNAIIASWLEVSPGHRSALKCIVVGLVLNLESLIMANSISSLVNTRDDWVILWVLDIIWGCKVCRWWRPIWVWYPFQKEWL